MAWFLFACAVTSVSGAIFAAVAEGLAEPPIDSCVGLCSNGPSGNNGTSGIIGKNGTAGPNATIDVGPTTTLPVGENASVVNSGNSTNASFEFSIPRSNTSFLYRRSYSPGGQQINPSVDGPSYQFLNDIIVEYPGTYYLIWEGTYAEFGVAQAPFDFFAVVHMVAAPFGVINGGFAAITIGNQYVNPPPYLDYYSASIIAAFTPVPAFLPQAVTVEWVAGGSLGTPNLTMTGNSITLFRFNP